MLAWHSSAWVMSNPSTKMFLLSAKVKLDSGRSDWWLTMFYAPS
jgi:hypothetical protein